MSVQAVKISVRLSLIEIQGGYGKHRIAFFPQNPEAASYTVKLGCNELHGTVPVCSFVIALTSL